MWTVLVPAPPFIPDNGEMSTAFVRLSHLQGGGPEGRDAEHCCQVQKKQQCQPSLVQLPTEIVCVGD